MPQEFIDAEEEEKKNLNTNDDKPGAIEMVEGGQSNNAN